jgi:peptidoglycan hydrolase FlgJ
MNKVINATETSSDLIATYNLKPKSEKSKLEKASMDFEALLIQQMLKSMRDASSESEGILPKSNEESLMTEMLDEEIAKEIASKSGIGVSKVLLSQFDK